MDQHDEISINNGYKLHRDGFSTTHSCSTKGEIRSLLTNCILNYFLRYLYKVKKLKTYIQTIYREQSIYDLIVHLLIPQIALLAKAWSGCQPA